ncbi:unnamed protein product [Caretta caretta]
MFSKESAVKLFDSFCFRHSGGIAIWKMTDIALLRIHLAWSTQTPQWKRREPLWAQMVRPCSMCKARTSCRQSLKREAEQLRREAGSGRGQTCDLGKECPRNSCCLMLGDTDPTKPEKERLVTLEGIWQKEQEEKTSQIKRGPHV